MTTWCLGFGINDNLIFRFWNKWQLTWYSGFGTNDNL